MGSDPKAIPTTFPKTNISEAEERIWDLQKAHDEALATHELAQQQMMEWATQNFKPILKNDLVWLESKHLMLWYESKKIAPKWERPFEFSEVLGPLTYWLKLPEKWKIHAVFLSPYKENKTHGPNYFKPPPDLINGHQEYKVEAINAHRRQGKSYLYLVKWKGYSTVENTWEPEQNLTHAKNILLTYKKRHQLYWNNKENKVP